MILHCNNEEIFYEVLEGKSDSDTYDAVLLLHSLGVDHHLWKYQLDALVECSPLVVLLDARGHGQSTATSGISRDQWAKDIKSVCDQLGLKKVVLCGISMGGVQAMVFSIMYPSYVGGLILADTFAKIDPEQVETKIDLTAGVAMEKGMEQYGDIYLDNTLSDSPSATDIRDELRNAIITMKEEDYYNSAKSCFTVNVEEQLKHIISPTLVLIGEKGLKTPFELSKNIQERIPNSFLKVIPNGMHLSNVDNPSDFTKSVTEFLNLI